MPVHSNPNEQAIFPHVESPSGPGDAAGIPAGHRECRRIGHLPRRLHRWRREVVEHVPDPFADPATVKRAAAAQDAKGEA